MTDQTNGPPAKGSLAVGSPNPAGPVNAYPATSHAHIDRLLSTLQPVLGTYQLKLKNPRF